MFTHMFVSSHASFVLAGPCRRAGALRERWANPPRLEAAGVQQWRAPCSLHPPACHQASCLSHAVRHAWGDAGDLCTTPSTQGVRRLGLRHGAPVPERMSGDLQPLLTCQPRRATALRIKNSPPSVASTAGTTKSLRTKAGAREPAGSAGGGQSVAGQPLVTEPAAPDSPALNPPREETKLHSLAVYDKVIDVFAQHKRGEWRDLIAFSRQWRGLAAGILKRCARVWGGEGGGATRGLPLLSP